MSITLYLFFLSLTLSPLLEVEVCDGNATIGAHLNHSEELKNANDRPCVTTVEESRERGERRNARGKGREEEGS